MSTVETSRLYGDPDYEPTLEEWNSLVLRAGRAYKSELSRRTVFESELFGMNTYIILAHLEDYLKVPERLARIAEAMAPEDIVAAGVPIGTKKNFICLAALPLHYLSGRELYVDLGELDLADDLDRHLEVLTFWRRATIAQRTDGVLLNIDAQPPDSARVLDDATVQRIRGDLQPTDDADMAATVRRFGAALTSYCFLENCDSRMAVCDTGPYPLEGGGFLALRELTTDGHGYFPWLDGIRDELPRHNFVIAYELPDDVRMENNIWGTAWFTPTDYLAKTTAVRVYVTDDDRLEPLDPADLQPISKAIRSAHRKLYQRFADMSERDRAIYATQMYAWKLKSWADTAGVLAEMDWELASRVTDMYERLSDDAVALQLLGGVFVPPDRDGCFRPLR